MRAGLAPLRRGRRRSGALAAGCAAIGLVGLLAACGPASSAASGGSSAAAGSPATITWAMQPGGLASYIFPFISVNESAADSVYNIDQFQYLLYRPLYWFGQGVTPYLNQQLSLAKLPTYHGHQVRIELKSNYKWSNGEPVDAQDVVFWMNMMIAEENSPSNAWIGTSAAGLPGDVTNVRAASKYVVTMDITSPKFSESWFTNNELSQITPMPAAWDRTASGPSNCATRIASCPAVYDYLNKQAQSVSTYGTSPLWGVVDGPWRVNSLDSQGNLTLAFNNSYGGPVAAHHVTRFVEVPFTSEQAEYNVLQDPNGSQAIDVGYLPTVDAPVPPAGAAVGANPGSMRNYSLTEVYPWGINYIPYNFANNTGQGAIFNQLYFRQAFQELVDQEGVINGPLHGYGKPVIGPVSAYPQTSFLSPQLARASDPWTLNIPKAKQALLSHGWVAHPNGPDTCAHPGTGLTECGPGVRAGISLTFNLIYATGIDYMQSAVRELASNASLAGIKINLQPEAFNDVTGTAFHAPVDRIWQLADWGGWTYQPDYLPTGETLFLGGSASNAGSYNDARNNNLINATLAARTPGEFDTAMYNWQNYLAAQLPVVWTPNTPTLLEAIKGLEIGPQNSAFSIMPELWFYRQ